MIGLSFVNSWLRDIQERSPQLADLWGRHSLPRSESLRWR